MVKRARYWHKNGEESEVWAQKMANSSHVFAKK
jgi:hypothetical protein